MNRIDSDAHCALIDADKRNKNSFNHPLSAVDVGVETGLPGHLGKKNSNPLRRHIEQIAPMTAGA